MITGCAYRGPARRTSVPARGGGEESASRGHQPGMDNDTTVTHVKETTVEKHTTVVEEPAPPPPEHHGETITITTETS